ncbi:MAG: hypothetical protein A2086_06465 [Spirochaetes bacterium GWD1_27_9]|nr:MAG: hypothetical protein A2Z98_12040 [Spirochaetes bacterium GWB1_27_13]OHD40648.1 MAG: hypothetical protein A2086_06465 [Spirochaetes bacterium GWD1_27_9]
MKKLIYFLLIIASFSCFSKKTTSFKDNISIKNIDDDVYIRYLNLHKKNNDILITYSEEKTLSLKLADISNDNISLSYIDKINDEKEIDSNTGRHFYITGRDRDYVFFNDYKSEKKTVFKVLMRKNKTDKWMIFPQTIKPFDFFVFNYKGEILIFYIEDSYKIAILKDFNFKELIKVDKIKDIENIRIIPDEKDDMINLFFVNEKNILYNYGFKIQLEQENLTITEKYNTKISDFVKMYDVATSDNNIGILYYDYKEYSLKFYQIKDHIAKTLKIGYFPDIHSLHLILLEKNPLFLYSSSLITKDASDDKKFYLSAIYNQKEKWLEEELLITESPMIVLNSYILDNKINILAGGNSLNQISIDEKVLNSTKN